MPSKLKPPLLSVLRWKWALPIITQLWKNKGAKFVYLHQKLTITKSVLSETLKRLMSEGIVTKNPGYGHPLRLEYLIAEESNQIAEKLAHLFIHLNTNGLLYLLDSKWSLPIVFSLCNGPRRFGEIQSVLESTNRSLTLALKKLQKKSLITRFVGDHYPVSVFYSLTLENAALTEILQLLESI